MAVSEKFIKVRVGFEECIGDVELDNLLNYTFKSPIVYDGFEPSGKLNIANCLMKMYNTKKLVDAGCTVIFWMADIFAQLNQKFGGDLKKIRTMGEYMIETWKATAEYIGMDITKIKFIWASEYTQKHAADYLALIVDISRRNNLKRMMRCTQALGRNESDTLTLGQLMYPAMQCADIFLLKTDICQMGLDQRKINMLAREYCNSKDAHKLAIRSPPVVLSHHMLLGLKYGQEKMSKSDPESCVYMDDINGDISRKIKRAYCPPGESGVPTKENPILDYFKYVVFPIFRLKGLTVNMIRKRENITSLYTHYDEMEDDYLKLKTHPQDLKICLKECLHALISPIRDKLMETNSKLVRRAKSIQKAETGRKNRVNIEE